METTVEELAYKALSSYSDLITLLNHGEKSVYTGKATTSDFPCIVISEISDVPSLYGDNDLIEHQSTIRVSIMVKRGQSLKALIKLVYNCMKGAGFYWSQSYDYEDDDFSSKIMQFNYSENLEEE